MERELPLISVIIPAYQAAGTLPRALDSALRQDYPALEIVVADDGSTDSTRQVVEQYLERDPRIRYFWQANQGVGGARNLAVANASGEYLAFLDADDEWQPGKLRLQAAILQQNASINVVFTNSLHVDVVKGSSQLFFDLYAPALRQLQREALAPFDSVFVISGGLREVLYGAGFIPVSSVMMRSSTYRQVGGSTTQRIGPEDLDLWMRAARVGRFAISYQTLALHHLTASSISRPSDGFHKKMILFYQMCLSSPDYADLRAAARRGLRTRYRHLVFYYGRHWRPLQALAAFRDSLETGFDWLSALCALGAWFGPAPFMAAGRLLWPRA